MVQEEMQRRAKKYQGNNNHGDRYPFSGKIHCVNCGKGYRRKISHAGKTYERIFWNCSTYLRFGKSACYTKQIPEDILYRVSAEAMGIDEFDAVAFDNLIKEIQVEEFNKLKFIFKNDTEKVYEWSDNGEFKANNCNSSS